MTDPHEPGMLAHDADGIRELDNQLPRWWLWLFILTVVYAAVYLMYYEITGIGATSTESYAAEMKAAGLAVPAAAVAADAAASTDPAIVDAGHALFTKNCIVCHGPQGGGLIGPNLCDNAFIHGPTFADMKTTIMEGVPAKGMITWKAVLKPDEIQAVASYAFTLRGTSPSNPKPPEGVVVP